MNYDQLTMLHLATILPAFLLGTYLMVRRKGTPNHRLLGKIYLSLMVITAVVTLFMPAQLGARLFNHFGFIHAFSLLALYSAPTALLAARRGNIKAHRASMIGLYVGGILIAGAFTLAPGRLMHDWVFGTHLRGSIATVPVTSTPRAIVP